MSRITVIGSSNIDLIMKMNTLPVKGETVTGGDFMQTFGGKGANQAVGAARAGGNVTFISCVGDDHYGLQCIENFKSDGIDTSNIFIEKDIATGTALIMIGDDGDNMISVAPGANNRMSPEHIKKVMKVIRDSEYVLLQYEIPQETLYFIIEECAKQKISVIFNLAPARDFDPRHISMLDTLVVNEVEAEFLVKAPVNDMEQIKDAAARLLEMGPKNVIITLGSHGSYVASGNYYEKIPAFKVVAQDSTAAGDVYCGSLAVAMLEGMPLHRAVGFASAASAISVTRMGAQPSAPHRREIEEMLKTED
ncbi:ribokinase [Bacteroidota bacterium]